MLKSVFACVLITSVPLVTLSACCSGSSDCEVCMDDLRHETSDCPDADAGGDSGDAAAPDGSSLPMDGGTD